MNTNPFSKLLTLTKVFSLFKVSLLVCLLIGQISLVKAGELTLQALDFSVLSGGEMQLQLKMNGTAIAPKVFQTDNPARIALDFVGVKNGLKAKLHPLNISVASSAYVLEVSGRLRIIVNLVESVPFETQVKGNTVYLTLKTAQKQNPIKLIKTESKVDSIQPKSTIKAADVIKADSELIVQNHYKKSPVVDVVNYPKDNEPDVSKFIPRQGIYDLDFRRGPSGEGRILVSLANPNTIVDIKEQGGKVIVNFLNTQLSAKLAKRVDVSDFATPISAFDIKPKGSNVGIIISPVNGNYEYSTFQTEGMLTIEFRPLTLAEKEQKKAAKFEFTGERLSLNFQSIEVRSVLQIMADFTDLNIVASDSVAGAVTLRLNNVPWDQALDLILKSKGLAKRRTGNVVLVAPFSEISQIEKEELAAQKVVAQLESLKTEYIQINYAKAQNFRSLLLGSSSQGSDGCSSPSNSSGGGGGSGTNNRGLITNTATSLVTDNIQLLSARGTAIVDARTNTLIVRDTPKNLAQIQEMLSLLDKPVRQVLIESRIVIAGNNFAKELGVKLGIDKQSQLPSDKTALLSGLVDLAAASPHGQLTMTLLRAGDYLLNLEITAMEDEGKGESISNPRLLTADRCKAIIKQGVKIPVQSTSGNLGTNVEYVDAELMLEVTPQITPGGSVIMDLNITKNAPGDPAANGNREIDTREIQTSVRVEDGETVVLGGVYEGDTANSINKVPFFSDLPAVGWMFTRTKVTEIKKELLIFVTPRIVKDSLSIQ